MGNPENSVHLIFTCCLFPGLKRVLGLMLFQLLSLLFGIYSLKMLSHQIAYFFLSPFENSPFQTRLSFLSFHFIQSFVDEFVHCAWTMSLFNTCTTCTTELNSFRGYWLYRSLLLLYKILSVLSQHLMMNACKLV